MPKLSSPLARLADHLLEGELEDKLRKWRGEGLSWDEVARELWLETKRQVSITGPGIQSWGETLGIPDPKAKSEQAAS